MEHNESKVQPAPNVIVTSIMYCVFGVRPYHSGLKPEATPLAFATDGFIFDAILHEDANGLKTAERLIHNAGEPPAC